MIFERLMKLFLKFGKPIPENKSMNIFKQFEEKNLDKLHFFSKSNYIQGNFAFF